MFGTKEDTETYANQSFKEQEAKRIRQAFKDCFSSPQGMVVMEYLEKTFVHCDKLVPGFADATGSNLGAEKVVRQMKRMASTETETVAMTYTTEEDDVWPKQ